MFHDVVVALAYTNAVLRLNGDCRLLGPKAKYTRGERKGRTFKL